MQRQQPRMDGLISSHIPTNALSEVLNTNLLLPVIFNVSVSLIELF